MKHDLSDSNAAGQVTLVGAGPGDPELLTLKALKAIQAATVLMVDDLVNEAIVAYASPEARIVHVGKRGGCKSTPQSFIEKLMVTAALEGENVVRLKGGDPFIFGRGGEEVENLQAAGIRVSVINGITSGLAAVTSLNVPLTHREHAHGVVFVTGHAKPGDTGTDWRALAHTAYQAKLTLVIYMGVSGAAHIQDELLYGLPDTTPVAIVHNASLPTQRHAVCTLGELQTTIAREGLASPSVIVVGDVMQGLLAAAQVPERDAPPERSGSRELLVLWCARGPHRQQRQGQRQTVVHQLHVVKESQVVAVGLASSRHHKAAQQSQRARHAPGIALLHRRPGNHQRAHARHHLRPEHQTGQRQHDADTPHDQHKTPDRRATCGQRRIRPAQA